LVEAKTKAIVRNSKIAPSTRELIETHMIAKQAQGEGVDNKYALYYQ